MTRTYNTTHMTDTERVAYLFSDPDNYNALIDALERAYLDMEGDRKNGVEDPDLFGRVTYWLDELQGPDEE